MEELDWPAQSPDLKPIEHLWDELERQLRARPNHPISVPTLTNALVAKWEQVHAAMVQHLVESLPRREEAVIAAKGDQLQMNALDFRTRCLTSRCPHTFGHVVYVLLRATYGPYGCLLGQVARLFLSERAKAERAKTGVLAGENVTKSLFSRHFIVLSPYTAMTTLKRCDHTFGTKDLGAMWGFWCEPRVATQLAPYSLCSALPHRALVKSSALQYIENRVPFGTSNSH